MQNQNVNVNSLIDGCCNTQQVMQYRWAGRERCSGTVHVKATSHAPFAFVSYGKSPVRNLTITKILWQWTFVQLNTKYGMKNLKNMTLPSSSCFSSSISKHSVTSKNKTLTVGTDVDESCELQGPNDVILLKKRESAEVFFF